jgi:hypothetical protein
LKLSEEYQTAWLTRRVSTFFLAKTKSDFVKNFVISDLYYYCDRYNLDTLKQDLFENHRLTFQFTEQLTKKYSYVALTDETKFKLAKMRLLTMLDKMNTKIKLNLREPMKNILDAIEKKEEPKVKEQPLLPFENVFKHADKTSDLVITVNKSHSINVHKKVVKRLSPKLKEILEINKNAGKELNHRVEDVNMFLFMFRFFYPKYHVRLRGA